MSQRQNRSGHSRRGLAMVMALAMTTVLVSLAVAMVSVTVLNLHMSDNVQKVSRARLAAESGLAQMCLVLRNIQLPVDMTPDTMAADIQAALSERMNVAPVLSATAPATVMLPAVDLGTSSYTCAFTPIDGQSCRLLIEGTSSGVSRWVSMRLRCVRRRSVIFNHGVSSRGKIVIKGSAHVEGVLRPSDASVLSTCDQPVAIEAGGHATVDGDLYIAGEDINAVWLTGGALSIGGADGLDEIYSQHVHVGTTGAEFPQTDTSPFAALATNVIDGNSDTSGTTYSNIRIKAGTNPTFNSDTVINGMIYVEAPNKVTFNGTCTVNGIIATADGSSYPTSDCLLAFSGNMDAPGVDALPDLPEYAAVKALTGTALLAPGFSAEFKGSSNGFNGVIAADQISFLGNSGISGEVKGTIVGLGDRDMVLSGNASIRIRGADSDAPPAGFIQPWGLDVDGGSYEEPVNGL